MRQESLEIDERFGKEYSGRYVFQEISWARRSRIIQKHTKYHPFTGHVLSSDFVAIQAETIWAGLREQPAAKPISLEKLLSEDQGIPIELGETFCKVANRLCGIAQDEQRFLSGQSGDTSRTQPSQGLGSARNSAGHRSSSTDSQQKPSRSFL